MKLKISMVPSEVSIILLEKNRRGIFYIKQNHLFP